MCKSLARGCCLRRCGKKPIGRNSFVCMYSNYWSWTRSYISRVLHRRLADSRNYMGMHANILEYSGNVKGISEIFINVWLPVEALNCQCRYLHKTGRGLFCLTCLHIGISILIVKATLKTPPKNALIISVIHQWYTSKKGQVKLPIGYYCTYVDPQNKARYR
jgi:hypothetical protein